MTSDGRPDSSGVVAGLVTLLGLGLMVALVVTLWVRSLEPIAWYALVVLSISAAVGGGLLAARLVDGKRAP